MSVKLSSYVWDGCSYAGLKLTKVAIMARLADFSNDDGISWPSVETIARQIGAGLSTVRRLINELETDGWLKKKERRKGNRNASNMYFLNVAKMKFFAEKAQIELEEKRNKSEPPNLSRSEFDPPILSGSNSFHPPDLSKKGCFDPPNLGDDPSLKHDPSDINTIGPLEGIFEENEHEKPTIEKTQTAKDTITSQAIVVLEHLNLTTRSRYQKSKTSLENIKARLNEGYSVEQLNLVIDYKNQDWGDDLTYSEYLRPATLFSPSKFMGYLSTAERWDRNNRPKKINGKWLQPNNKLTPATSEIPAGWR